MAAGAKEIRIEYVPRPQFIDFHARTQRWACIVAHRRAGKTVACIHDLQRGAVSCPLPRPRFAYLAPYLKQSKAVSWDYLKEAARPFLKYGAQINESELRIDYPNGGQVRVYGADNPDALRGLYLDGVVMDEFADMDPDVWPSIVRPALADRQGWAVIIGTPKGHNAFYDIWDRSRTDKDWFSLMLKAEETGLLAPSELESNRRDLGRDRYAQEYECSFEAAILGAFYAEEMARMLQEKRIGKVPVERAIPVHTAWDLGMSDSTAIWFIQAAGREFRLVDYYEGSGVGLDVYAKVLKEKGYLYGDHYFPHDVAVRELSMGVSRQDTLRGLGIEPTVVGRHEPLDGINAVRRMLDRAWLDEERCKRGLEALRQYRREWDDKLKDFKKSALHDWSSHGCDALRSFAAGFVETSITNKRKRERYRVKAGSASWMSA